MKKHEALELKERIAQEMPIVQVGVTVKKHQGGHTYTLKLLHTGIQRTTSLFDPEQWESIKEVWLDF